MLSGSASSINKPPANGRSDGREGDGNPAAVGAPSGCNRDADQTANACRILAAELLPMDRQIGGWECWQWQSSILSLNQTLAGSLLYLCVHRGHQG